MHISIGLLVIAALAVFGLRLYLLDIHSPNLGAMETSVVYGLQRILAGLPLYSDPEQAPFAIIQYSPLYYELPGQLGKMLSIDPEQVMQVYQLNRWGALIFNLISLLVLGLILKPLVLPKYWKGAILAIAWLCLEPAHYARPDSLQALFFLLFVWAGWRYEASENSRYVLLLALTATLACWTKQNGILLILFLPFYLILLKKQFIQAFVAVLAMGILSLALGFWLIQDPEILWANVIQGVDNGLSLSYFFSAIYDVGIKKFFPIFIGGLYFAIIWLFFAGPSSQKFLGWLLAGSFAFASITALKWGSIPSYYTDFVHLSLIAFAVAAEKWYAGGKLNFSVPTTVFLSLALVFFIPLHTSGKEWGRVLKEGKEDNFHQAENIRREIQARGGLAAGQYIFTHDYLINLYLYKYCLFPQNDIIYCCAAPRHTYDFSRFAEAWQAGKIRYVIDWKGAQARAFLGQEFEGFSPLDTIGDYSLFGRLE